MNCHVKSHRVLPAVQRGGQWVDPPLALSVVLNRVLLSEALAAVLNPPPSVPPLLALWITAPFGLKVAIETTRGHTLAGKPFLKQFPAHVSFQIY